MLPDGTAPTGTEHDEVQPPSELNPISSHELLARTPAGMYVTRADEVGSIIWVSRRAADIFGLEPHELVGEPDVFIEHLHPDDRERALAVFDEVAETRRPFELEYRIVRADGEVTWVLDVAIWCPDAEGGPGFWHGVMVPVDRWKDHERSLAANNELLEAVVAMRTEQLREINELLQLEIEERRRANRELEATEAYYRTIVEGLPVQIYAWDLSEGEMLGGPYTNPSSEREWGFSVEQAREGGIEYWNGFLHPDDSDRVWAGVRRSIETGEPYRDRYRWITPDGRLLDVVDRADAVAFDDAGRPLRFVGVMIDISGLEAGPTT